MQQVHSRIETINPNLASEYLSTMGKNRTLSTYKVDEYAKMMEEGLWMLNGEAIVFDKNNQLVNGQHRLEAVIKSGKDIEFLVVRGVESKCFLTYDNGKLRTAADVFNIDGIKNSSQIASIVRKEMVLEEDSSAVILSDKRKIKIPKATLLERYKDNKETYDNAAHFAYNLNHKLNLFSLASIGAIVSYLEIWKGYERNDIEHFFKMLFQYKTTSDMNCLKYIRDKIVSSSLNGAELKPKVKQNLVACAWNLYRENKDAKRIPMTEENCWFH